MSRNPKIVCIVPAHNEEEIISETLRDLLDQSMRVSILVVADNCTDATVEIVKNYQNRHKRVGLIETLGNDKRKAGAINQAIHYLEGFSANLDAVLIMDADTRIDPNAVRSAWQTLKSDPVLAAVCSKAGVLPFKGKIFRWPLYQLQRLEYAMFDSQRVETLDEIKVVHGMCALHRWSALFEVGGFDDNNLVEDYDLTLRYKEAGYKVTVDLNMKAWTDVPLSLKGWWFQRLRWNRGGVDTLREHGVNSTTIKYIWQHILMNVLYIFQWIFLVAFIYMVIKGPMAMHGLVLVVMFLSIVSGLYRLRYLENRNWKDYIARLLIFPEMLYGFLQILNQYHAYINSFLEIKQDW